jgi:probable rRNA maturation factor
MPVEVEVSGEERLTDGPDLEAIERLSRLAFAAAGVEDGHAAVAIVDESEIHALNLEHRAKDAPTDVLSFPVDGAGPVVGPRELGDVVICPEFCESVTRAVVHGALHLVGMDHEVDGGEMLAVEAEILRWEST